MSTETQSTTVPTFVASIYVGTIHGYARPFKPTPVTPLERIESACREYCDRVGLCVTVTPTTFVYKGRSEPGAAIGLINYPRFPSALDAFRKRALDLAGMLKELCGQIRVSVVMTTGGETTMIGPME